MIRFRWQLVLACLTLVSAFKLSAFGQESGLTVEPKQMGFTQREIEIPSGKVQYFLSTEGKPLDTKRTLPLVVFLHGSGPSPFFFGVTKIGWEAV